MFTTEAIPTYMVAHGGCYVCSSADGLVSTGVEIEGEGILAICRGHVHDMAIEAGFRLEDETRLSAMTEERDRYRTQAAVEHERAVLAEQALTRWKQSVRDVLEPTSVPIPEEPIVERPKNLRDPLSGKLIKRP